MRVLPGINKLALKYPAKEDIIQYLCDKLDVNYIYERYDFVVDKTAVIIKDLDLTIDNKELVQSLRNAHSLVLCFYSFNIDATDLFDVASAHQFFVQNAVVKFHKELKCNEEFDQSYIMSNCEIDSSFRSLLHDKLCKAPFMTISGIKHAPIINHYQDSCLYESKPINRTYTTMKKGA